MSDQTPTRCWLIVYPNGAVAKEFDIDPRQQLSKLPAGTQVATLGSVGATLSLAELSHRLAEGIDLELRLRWKLTAPELGPGGFKELS